MWSFVAKKQANCDPDNPADDHEGDWWDYVVYDAEHRLVLAVVPGARSIENAEEAVGEAHDRTGGREDVLLNTRPTRRRSTMSMASPKSPSHPAARADRR
jgi:hypothetical protein